MKDILVLLIILLNAFTLKGQVIEQYVFRDSLTIGRDAIYHDGAIFLVKGKKQNLIQLNCGDPILYKLDNSLNLLDSLQLSTLISPTSKFIDCYFANLVKISTDTIAITLNIYEDSVNLSQSFVVFLNTSLAYLGKFSLNDLGDSLVYGIQKCKQLNKGLLISGTKYNTNLGYNKGDGFIAEFSFQGIKLKEGVIPWDTLQTWPFPPPWPLISIADFYSLNSGFLVSFYPFHYYYNLAEFDSSLTLKKLIAVKDTPWGFGVDLNVQFIEHLGNQPKIVTQTTRFMTNIVLPPDTVGYGYDYHNLAMITLGSNYEFASIDTFTFSKNQIFDTIISETTSLDYGLFDVNSTKDTALIMSTNMQPSVFYFSKPNPSTYISNFNPNSGLVNWSKVFNKGYVHDAQQVVSMPNNRWLLLFNEYNWDKFGNETMCIHLFIIDSNGNPIGITENEEKALSQEPMVYPNPASTHLTIGNLHWPGNQYTYQITDTKGALVLSGALPISGQITLPEALNGVYVITITNQTGFGWARKVVIE